MPTIISLVFLVSFASLSFWLLFKDSPNLRKYFAKLFGLSFLVYLSYQIIFPGPLGYVNLVIGLVMLFVGAFVLNVFSNNKILFVLLLGAALIGLWNLPNIPRIPFLNTSSKVEDIAIDPDFELLVELKEGVKVDDLSKIFKKYALTYERAFEPNSPELTDLDDFIAVNIPEQYLKDLNKIVLALEKSGKIDGLEQNEIVSLFTPQKTSKRKTGKRSSVLNDPDLDKIWSLELLQMDKLHKMLTEKKVKAKKKSKIAIIDTGIDIHHEDISKNYISTRIEYDEDIQGHGTHCAGIAAAVSNNKKGIASFSPSNDFVEVTSIQVFPRRGGTTQRTIIRGMILAADSGVDVLSMSLGGPSNDAAQRAYKEAVQYANKKGAIVIVAAGNENTDARKKVPASVEGVITVAAIDQKNKKASFSNDISAIEMGLAAPGVNIFSTMPDSKYDYMSGTSMATPYVSGLVALLKSLKPTLDTHEAFELLHNSGINSKSGNSVGRIIQPYNTVKSLLKL